MTADQVLAKVRAAASGPAESPAYTICARAALAMVDAIVQCDDAITELTALPEYPPSAWQQGRLAVWREQRAWLLSALRTAVGEVQL